MINWTKLDNSTMNCYIVKTTDGQGNCMVKFGYSANIKQRMRIYHSNNPFIKLLYIGFHPEAKSIEKVFHNRQKSCSGREWYTLEVLPLMLQQFEEGGNIRQWNQDFYLNEPWNAELSEKRKRSRYNGQDFKDAQLVVYPDKIVRVPKPLTDSLEFEEALIKPNTNL